MKSDVISQLIKKTLIEEFMIDLEEKDMDEDISIFEFGIDSMDFFSLLDIIKKQFDITIKDNELNLENFYSIRTMVNYIEHKHMK